MRMGRKWSLSVAQTTLAVMLLNAGHHQEPLGGFMEGVPLPPFWGPATEICQSLNWPATVASELVVLALRALHLPINGDHMFVAAVFLLWYMIGRSIDSEKRIRAQAKDRGKLRTTAYVLLLVAGIGAALSATSDWGWTHRYSMSTALVQTGFDGLWAVGMLWTAVRHLRAGRGQCG
jgi:hypothetical protein